MAGNSQGQVPPVQSECDHLGRATAHTGSLFLPGRAASGAARPEILGGPQRVRGCVVVVVRDALEGFKEARRETPLSMGAIQGSGFLFV